MRSRRRVPRRATRPTPRCEGARSRAARGDPRGAGRDARAAHRTRLVDRRDRERDQRPDQHGSQPPATREGAHARAHRKRSAPLRSLRARVISEGRRRRTRLDHARRKGLGRLRLRGIREGRFLLLLLLLLFLSRGRLFRRLGRRLLRRRPRLRTSVGRTEVRAHAVDERARVLVLADSVAVLVDADVGDEVEGDEEPESRATRRLDRTRCRSRCRRGSRRR